MVVGVHYEFLRILTCFLAKAWIKNRPKLVFGVFGALIAHAIEICIYGVVYFNLNTSKTLGGLKGAFDGSLMDCIYFSYTSYTTVGFGDIQPFGPIRFVSSIESLTGVVLITWTASFLFIEMQKHWRLP
jgi:hypothetical protein